MQLTEALKTNDSLTENGMVTNSTSLNLCLDFFFKAGAMRNSKDDHIIKLASHAFGEDPERALKILFWARDIRGGAGERRFFRVAFSYISDRWKHDMKMAERIISLIPEYGRWDDMLMFEDTPFEEMVLDIIEGALHEENQLCAKWMPRKGTFANKLRKHLRLSPKEYRKLLVSLNTTVERRLCAKEFNQVDYNKVPSLAMARYGQTFQTRDRERFFKYLEDLRKGKSGTKINTGAIYPYDVIKSLDKNEAAQEQWDNLPNFLEGNTERILPLVDVSGSMETECGGNLTCLDVAISLGLYISERNEGPFHNHFMTFSGESKLVHVNGTLKDRFIQMSNSNWGMNTNLCAAFDNILKHAVANNIQPEEMPTQILILSDMEFDKAEINYWSRNIKKFDLSAQEMIRERYENSGYEMPNIVYWNIQSRNDGNLPVRFNELGTALVSGFSPSILTALLSGETMNPINIMDSVIMGERYKNITFSETK
jgi:hypothetical protein